MSFNALPKDNFLGWTKLKAFADDKLSAGKIKISVLERIENIVGKRSSIFSFATMFLKAISFRVVKSRDCVVKS